MFKMFKLWWTRSQMSQIEKYLSESEDMVDLEQRQKRLQRRGIWL